jgi:hypothetical protein
MGKARLLLALAACGAAVGGAALAADLTLTRAESTPLTEGNVGKPFWSLDAQCAGIYGADYAFEKARDRDREAQIAKANGVAMLDTAIAHLQVDRGLDRAGAMTLAEPEVEFGRNAAKAALEREGNGPNSDWNYFRSTCVDIAAADRNGRFR